MCHIGRHNWTFIHTSIPLSPEDPKSPGGDFLPYLGPLFTRTPLTFYPKLGSEALGPRIPDHYLQAV